MFKLNLYTPDGIVVKNYECEELLIPTIRGEIDVLEGHTHILTNLTTGILKVRKEQTWKYFSITHGTCKILGDQVSILSMTSEKAEDIDKTRAEDALSRAQKKLVGEDEIIDDADLEKQRMKEKRARMRLELAYMRGE